MVDPTSISSCTSKRSCAGATYLGQLTHPFNTQAALQRHHFPDLVVDAFAPESLPCWRRASIFCKAHLKKSSSRVFSASTRLSWLTSLRIPAKLFDCTFVPLCDFRLARTFDANDWLRRGVTHDTRLRSCYLGHDGGGSCNS